MMFSVSETLEDAIQFSRGAVTRITILCSHVTDQIPSLKFRSQLYRRSLSFLSGAVAMYSMYVGL